MSIRILAESLPLTLTDEGKGPVYLVLHGGGGARSIEGLAQELAKGGRVIAPTHPGFDGTARPEWFRSVDALATAYLALLERLDVTDVTVVGNSLGGWIASEIALRHSPRVKRIVLLNAVGIAGEITDMSKIPPLERSAFSFHDPKRFSIPPVNNMEALLTYAPVMQDPNLLARLAQIDVPALVVWGESDRVVDLTYGQRFAQAIPGARFCGVKEAGHFPHVERLDEVVALIRG